MLGASQPEGGAMGPKAVPKLSDQPQVETVSQAEFERRTLALASAAHELKTPLTILSGYVDLLLTEKMGALNPKQRKVLTEMQATRVRLQHFIEDFLNYGAMITGNLTLRFQSHDIRGCLQDICGVWEPRFQEKLVAFYQLDCPPIEPFEFDYYKVQHVISNLLHNALKFTPSKGTVWLSAEPYYWDRRSNTTTAMSHDERRKQPERAPNSVRIIVSDTGPGISPEHHLEIFEDFGRGETGPEHPDSTGLGLAVARSLVHAHSGKIWVESTLGSGSKFCFLLPLKQHNEDEAEE